MTYQLSFRERAVKDLNRRITRQDKDRIIEKLKILSNNPFNPQLNIKKLSHFENLEKAYCLRVGSLRVIYELENKPPRIIVYQVGYRTTTTY